MDERSKVHSVLRDEIGCVWFAWFDLTTSLKSVGAGGICDECIYCLNFKQCNYSAQK